MIKDLPVQEIDWNTVRRLVVGSSDLGDSSVGGHDNDWGLVAFESSIQEREALDVEHMDLASSMKRTPGTISALPSSLHSATFWSICSLTSGLISPMSPANRAMNP